MNYLYLEQSLIKDKQDFYKSGVKEAGTINKLVAIARRLFALPDTAINLYSLGETTEGYLLELLGGRLNKELIGKIYYLPKAKIFDIYDKETSKPLFGWRNKILKISSAGSLMDVVHAEKLFSAFLAVI